MNGRHATHTTSRFNSSVVVSGYSASSAFNPSVDTFEAREESGDRGEQGQKCREIFDFKKEDKIEGAIATCRRWERWLNFASLLLAFVAVGLYLTSTLSGCATTQNRVESAFITVSECVETKAVACISSAAKFCAALPTRSDRLDCAREYLLSCAKTVTTICVASAVDDIVVPPTGDDIPTGGLVE